MIGRENSFWHLLLPSQHRQLVTKMTLIKLPYRDRLFTVVVLSQVSEGGPHTALKLCVGGGRVSDSWCMCVVNHDCGGLDGGRDGGGGW